MNTDNIDKGARATGDLFEGFGLGINYVVEYFLQLNWYEVTLLCVMLILLLLILFLKYKFKVDILDVEPKKRVLK